MSTIKSDVIFLFGAGASVDAEIPDTYSFVEKFERYIEHQYPDLAEALSKIKKVCEAFNGREGKADKKPKVDIEQLLGILRRLINKEDDQLLYFYEEKVFSLTVTPDVFKRLQIILEDFIREQVIAKVENLEYLQELLKFDTPIEIYSTNYDTCIEQLCYRNRRRYTDGFDITWNENNFNQDYEIKHYKLHGSVTWYTNATTKECVKIPIRAFFDDGKPVHLRLIYGDEVKPLIIYPAQKSEYMEPLTDLQVMFKRRLFKDTRIVIVVGYSCRDNYIVNMLWDAARTNPELHILLIAPDAKNTFEKRLKCLPEGTPSSLVDRVICLSYPFASVIPEIKTHYVKGLRQFCETEKDSLNQERDKGWANWELALKQAIDCEFLVKAEEINKKINFKWDKLDNGIQADNWFVYAFKGLFSSLANDGATNVWIQRINSMLSVFQTEHLDFNSSTGFTPIFKYNISGQSHLEMNMQTLRDYLIKPVFEELYRYNALLGPFSQKLDRLNQNLIMLDNFRAYITELSEIQTWEQYELKRPEKKDIITSELEIVSSNNDWDHLKEISLKIEREKLQSIFWGNTPIFRYLY